MTLPKSSGRAVSVRTIQRPAYGRLETRGGVPLGPGGFLSPTCRFTLFCQPALSSIFSRNGTYYIQFYRSTQTPRSKRFSLRTKDREGAGRLQARLDRLWRAGQLDPWAVRALPIGNSPPSPTGALEAFLKNRRRRGRRRRTLETYRSLVGLFLRRCGRERLSEISPSDVEAFVWDPSVAAGTRAGRDRTLRTFFRWAVQENLLAESPIEGFLAPRKPERIPRNVTLEELDRICAALRKDYREKRARNACRPGELLWMERAFRLAFLTGLRIMEIARLRWRDVDLSRRRLYLFRQKGGREEALPLGRKATSLLASIGEGRPESYVFVSPRSPRSARNEQSFATRLSKAFTRYRRAAGVQRKVTFHGLRHGFCTTLAEAGASGPVIQAAARHRELSTSMRYVHLTGDFLRKQIDEAFA